MYGIEVENIMGCLWEMGYTLINIELKLEQISKLLNPDEKLDNYEQIKQIVSQIISPTHVIDMEISFLNVYRVRKIESPNINFDRSSIWCPPPKLTKLNRGNLPGNQYSMVH